MKLDPALVQGATLRLTVVFGAASAAKLPLGKEFVLTAPDCGRVAMARSPRKPSDDGPDSPDPAPGVPRLLMPDVSVSQTHASCEWRDGGWWVTDLGSTNGTFVNFARLDEGVPAALKEGDILRIGEVDLAVSITPQLDADSATVADALAVEFRAATDAAAAAAAVRQVELYQEYLRKRRHALKAMGVKDSRDFEGERLPGVGLD